MIRAHPRHPRSIDTYFAINTLIPYTQLSNDLRDEFDRRQNQSQQNGMLDVCLYEFRPPPATGASASYAGGDFFRIVVLLFSDPVRIAVEDDERAFVGSSAIHITGGLLRLCTDQRI